ncbi:hypothetical protein PU630_15370 [Microbacterium horticulturae]|uniref:Cthe-2314-like HEPN domain-containing protein n=1 Tax=Microbacterium horticulturae TaxID=3028316 RepID=A0ABY8BWP7_9MICO|nr:hypothetical protein [Microbacterium sp. KACC 23027]WEG08604.1 hypothetical protein PU630_15370 [Microbacterium sp. KACC 23027]
MSNAARPTFHEAIEIWEHFFMAHNVMSLNTEALVEYFRRICFPGELAFQYLQAVSSGERRNEVKDGVDLEVNRLTLNYLASVATLVDISRNTISHYAGTATASEYDDRVASIRGRGLGPLLMRLRAHVLHHEHLPWATRVYFGNEGRLLDIVVRRDELLAYKDMRGPARRYLESLDSNVPFIDLVIDYGREAGELNAWLWTQMANLHRELKPAESSEPRGGQLT